MPDDPAPGGQPRHARSAAPRLAGANGRCFLGLRSPPHCLYLAADRHALSSQRADVPRLRLRGGRSHAPRSSHVLTSMLDGTARPERCKSQGHNGSSDKAHPSGRCPENFRAAGNNERPNKVEPIRLKSVAIARKPWQP